MEPDGPVEMQDADQIWEVLYEDYVHGVEEDDLKHGVEDIYKKDMDLQFPTVCPWASLRIYKNSQFTFILDRYNQVSEHCSRSRAAQCQRPIIWKGWLIFGSLWSSWVYDIRNCESVSGRSEGRMPSESNLNVHSCQEKTS